MRVSPTPKISIIIPTFDEAMTIASLLRSIAMQQLISELEVIVVDGGSADGTRDHVAGFPFARVLQTRRGLMNQLHTGALAAKAPVLWFLHADSTIPHSRASNKILEALDNNNVLGGCFKFKLRGDELFYQSVSLLVNFRTKFFKKVYGDQGIFARRDAYLAAGGFQAGPCGDTEFFTRLRKKGQTVFLNDTVETSARTWQHYGKWHTLTYHLREWCSYEFSRNNKL